MLTGRLPYGAQVSHIRTPAQARKLVYTPIADVSHDLPLWVDGALRKALHPDPEQRFAEPAEFAYALRNPVIDSEPTRLIDRDPLKFWKMVSALLGAAVVALLFLLTMRR